MMIYDFLMRKSTVTLITRPRRFGKTSVEYMVAAYYSKAVDSKDIFDNLNISKVNSYEENLNKYNLNYGITDILQQME